MITNIEDQLARDEGRELIAYRDTRNLWTIGVGHLLGATVPPQFQNGISDQQCDNLFAADLHHVWDLLDVYLPWWTQLDGNLGPRSNVLVNMGFNLGVAGLASFHNFLNFMRGKQWPQAAQDLRGTEVYKQLPERYERLAQQIVLGAWQ